MSNVITLLSLKEMSFFHMLTTSFHCLGALQHSMYTGNKCPGQV